METLRLIRERAGLSQPELSEISGVAQGTISDIELGKRKPHGSTLRKLAQALGVEVADFFPKGIDPKLLEEHLLEEQLRAHGSAVLGESYFLPPEEGEEPDIVTLRFYVWRELKKDDALLRKVAELLRERDKARAEAG